MQAQFSRVISACSLCCTFEFESPHKTKTPLLKNLKLAALFALHLYLSHKRKNQFYHATVTKPLVCDLIVVEVSSHTARMVPVKSYNDFSRPLVEKRVV